MASTAFSQSVRLTCKEAFRFSVAPPFLSNGLSITRARAGKWVGGVTDLGAVTNGAPGGFNVDTTVVNFVAGPPAAVGRGGPLSRCRGDGLKGNESRVKRRHQATQ